MIATEWTLARRLTIAFAVPVALFIAVGVVSSLSVAGMVRASHWDRHTQAVLAESAGFLASLTAAESAQRGYMITSQDAFLNEHNAWMSKARDGLQRLAQLTGDNAAQQRHIETVREAFNRKRDVMVHNMDLRRAGGLEAAVRLISAGTGKHAMDELRADLARFDDAEHKLLTARSHDTSQRAALTRGTILYGTLLATLIVLLAGMIINRRVTRQLAGAVSQMQSSSAELQAAANQQTSQAREQASSMAEIATTMNQLLASSRQIASAAQMVAQIAVRTSELATGGRGNVQAGQEATSSIRSQVDALVGNVLQLGRRAQEIGAVVEIVSELAEQTNIVSINATIEAAGAGEAGRRFGAVADELRKLADRVGGSAKDIRTMVDGLRSSVNSSVMATEGSAKAVEIGMRQFGELAGNFGRIAELVVNAMQSAREIELSTKQQSTASEQVTFAVATLLQASRESEVSTHQTLQTASQLAATSTDLMRMVSARRLA